MQIRPSKPGIMYQGWRNLLFLHWKYDKKEIQKTLPEGLYVDTFDDAAYISIVPFFIQNLRARFFPSLPCFSDFVEVNVRTYVYDRNGIPGVWFYSLDINSLLATVFARQFFYLPYQRAKLVSEIKTNEIKILGERIYKEKVQMLFIYQPTVRSIAFKAEAESLDFFLLERYALFSAHANKVYIEQIHHAPYLPSGVNLIDYKSNLLKVNDFEINQALPDAVHYCEALDVDFFSLERIF